MERKIFWLSLLLAGLSPRRFKKLKERIKDIEELFSLPFEELIKMKVPPTTAEKIVNWKKLPWEEEIRKIEKEKVKIVTIEDENYPEILKEIYDPPYLLYVKGTIEKNFYGIGIVGTRNPSFYGLKTSEKFAMELSSVGFTVVSGLARGIDTAAHTGAIKVKGKTIGVLGSGFSHFYPPENINLAEKIIENGAVITEFPFETLPEKRNFPMRNRIISGLSKGVIVVEAGQKSGALITANLALEQGREVFAVPGRTDTLTSKGTNKLLKDGAILIENINDVLEALNIEIKKVEREEKIKYEIELNEIEKKVYEVIKEKINFEKLLYITGIEYPLLTKTLLNLQLKGLIKELPGKIYTRE